MSISIDNIYSTAEQKHIWSAACTHVFAINQCHIKIHIIYPLQTHKLIIQSLEELIRERRFASDSRYVRNCRWASRLDVCAPLHKWSPQCFHLWIGVAPASLHCIPDGYICSSFCKHNQYKIFRVYPHVSEWEQVLYMRKYSIKHYCYWEKQTPLTWG